MKNILIITGVFVPEPVTSAIMNYDLAVELSKEYNVIVLRPKPSRPIGSVYNMDDCKHPFKSLTLDSYVYPESKLFGRFRESISFGIACKDYIIKHKDEIDFVYNDGWQLFGLYLVAQACVKLNIPYMVPIQDIYPECLFTNRRIPRLIKNTLISLLRHIDRYYQKNASCIRTISQEMAEYLSKTRRIELDKYLVVDNWQNDEDYAFVPITNNRTIFGYVGSINAHSNTELIIKAFTMANIPDCELHIYGGGNHKEKCLELVKELGVSNIFFDVVKKEQVPEVQSRMSVLVLALPSGNGGLCLPSKVTSYMLSGRPILASVETSTTQRYISDSDCGLAVEPDNIESLVDGFRKFASMSVEKKNRLGMNSRKFAEERLLKVVNINKVYNKIKIITE